MYYIKIIYNTYILLYILNILNMYYINTNAAWITGKSRSTRLLNAQTTAKQIRIVFACAYLPSRLTECST